ncbi:MAG: murein biosynthesis integral membrane protein MurJ [Oscillospiraceae bacterium]|nr:murein biosynthesis integral membrane protein MurJ [Oscillospiraceae bacterium]
MSKKETGQKILLTAVFMAVATLLSKVLGQARDSILTAYFGSGVISDAFLTASTIPTTFFDVIIGGVISATFIPVFNDIMSKHGKEEAMKFVNKFVTMIVSISVVIVALGILFRGTLVSIQTNYVGEKHALTAQLTAIMFPMIIFTGLAFSFVGLLQSFGEYKIPAIISLVSNTAIILYYPLFAKRFGVYGLSVTMVIAWSLQFLILVPWIKKFGVKFRPDFRFKDPYIKQALTLAGPMLISTWVQPLYTVINQRFASNIESAVTYIQQSNRLYIIVVGVFSFVVTNLIFPKLAKAVAEGNDNEARNLTVTSMRSIVLVIAPLMAIFMVLHNHISNLIFGFGKMDSESIAAIGALLKFYAIGMLGLGLNEILSKAFFSMNDSKTPMRNSVISMVINIMLAYLLYRLMSTNGLALAAAFGSIVNAALNWYCMTRRNKGIIGKNDVVNMLKSVLSAFIMGVAMALVYMLIKNRFTGWTGSFIICVICGICGIIVYGILLLITGEEDVKNIIRKKR